MEHTIHFSVHRNPQKDAQGSDTYQVRQETRYTLHTSQLLDHLRRHNRTAADAVQAALPVLQQEIVEQLTDNRRLRLDGIGTFYLKLGFRPRTDEDGRELQPRFTDPADITGDAVCIESIGFTPDREFLELARQSGVYFANLLGRGRVGHSLSYTRPQLEAHLRTYFQTHDHLTRRQMRAQFGLTRYMADKWLQQLTATPQPFLTVGTIGRTTVYHLSTD